MLGDMRKKEVELSPHRQAQLITPNAKAHTDFLHTNNSKNTGKNPVVLDYISLLATSAYMKSEAVIKAAIGDRQLDDDLIAQVWMAGYIAAESEHKHIKDFF